MQFAKRNAKNYPCGYMKVYLSTEEVKIIFFGKTLLSMLLRNQTEKTRIGKKTKNRSVDRYRMMYPQAW